MQKFIIAWCLVFWSACLCPDTEAAGRPNILLITVDDMNCDSVGVFGCELKGTTPNLDKFASEAMRFKYAHVQVGNCMPCRNVLLSGRYPHSNGVEGFRQIQNDYPVAADLFKQAGYYTGIRGKESHSTPYHPYPGWNDNLTEYRGQTLDKKDVVSFGESTARGIAAAKEAGKPFFINVNVSDPHKPFYAGPKDRFQPSRVFSADEVPVPNYLIAHPDVRSELAHYYSSVRRADDAFGEIMKALTDSGEADKTVVVFLSDHGMPMPFAKTQLYHHSTHTPWMVRWPGTTKPNSQDIHHMISAIDALPTLLDIAQIDHPTGLQGRSFLPLLKGQDQESRDHVVKEYNENSGRQRTPMRSVQTRKYLYIYNPWSNGSRIMTGATMGTAAYRVMEKRAESDPEIAARLQHFKYRTYEEFYDVENDPDALFNLIDSPEHRDEIDRHRKILGNWMAETNDFLQPFYAKRSDQTLVEAYMTEQDKVWAEHRARKRRKNK